MAKRKETATIEITAELAERLIYDMCPDADPAEICRKYKSYETVETFTAQFENSVEMDVKVCCGDCNDTGSNPLWTEAVLFDHGCEIATSEVRDQLYPHWEIETDEAIYEVTILKPSGTFVLPYGMSVPVSAIS